MTILGIDPGTARMGYGVIQTTKSQELLCVTYGCLETRKGELAGDRLVILELGLQKLLKEYQPDIAVVERLYFFKNLKTAMPVSEARGVVLLTVARKKIPVFELTPLQAKMAITGYGRAEKKQVQRMVQQILKLSELPQPDDAADALGLAIAYSAIPMRQ